MAKRTTLKKFEYDQYNSSLGQREIMSNDLRTRVYAEQSVTNSKILNLIADKITAGTISVGVNLGNENNLLDGENSRLVFYDSNNVPRVVIQGD